MARPELSRPGDLYFNYCLWGYQPIAPVAEKLRSCNLLFQSFDLAKLDERAFELVRTLRQAVGLFHTVFGIKWIESRLAWEFYFYDYKRRERVTSITRVLEALRPFARSNLRVNENLPYFMFSLDIDADLLAGRRELDTVHMYVGNPGSTVSSGIAYAVTPAATRLENLYFFFDAKSQLREAAEKICRSPYVDSTRMDLDQILRPELRRCRTICVANKQTHDTVYFSEVDVDQLLFFLRLLRYPSEVTHYVEANRSRLDHLLYDVGFDYRTENGNDLVVLKSGYYGVF